MLCLIWTVIGTLAYARHYLQDQGVAVPAKILFEFLAWLTCFYPWIAFAPLVFRAERAHPLGGSRTLSSLAYLTAIGLPLSFLAAFAMQGLYRILQVIFPVPINFIYPWWRLPLREIAVQVALYWTTVGGAYLIRRRIELGQREAMAAKLALEKAQLEGTLRSAELDALRSRLNPHFLFNSLQNISVLTNENPTAATQMLARLGVLLRAALRQQKTPETTLSTEMELVENYLAIEKLRFADRLTVHFDIANETQSALVPALLLQPLLENAIRHGLRESRRAGVITVRSTAKSGKLVLTVIDNGAGLRAASPADIKLGVGLDSTLQRLSKMYPDRHSFSIRSLPEGGTEVHVSLPLHFEHSLVSAISDEKAATVNR